MKIINSFFLCMMLTSLLKCDFKPTFLIIGAMKCGTTSLYRYLVQHPKIQQSKKKEVEFFDENFYKGVLWYKDQFYDQLPDQIVGDASPIYMFYPLVAQRVHNLYPNMKIIILLRNPVERAISHYFYIKPDILSFEDGIKIENIRVRQNLENLKNGKAYDFQSIRRFGYLSRGLYLEQIKEWTKYFPRKQIMFIISEEFINNREKTLNEVFNFIGVKPQKIKCYGLYNKNDKREKRVKSETIDWLYNYYKKPNADLEKFLGRKLPWNKPN